MGEVPCGPGRRARRGDIVDDALRDDRRSGFRKERLGKASAIEEPDSVLFDAILVKRSERAPILAIARQRGVSAVAVWLQTPLDVCLRRNAARPPDEIAGERGLRNVYAALEPPQLTEGFASILIVPYP